MSQRVVVDRSDLGLKAARIVQLDQERGLLGGLS
jgi:hypothetical protein